MTLEVSKKSSIRENEEKYITPEVLYGLRTKQEYAFEIVYRVYNNSVHTVVFSIIGDKEATRDLCQEIFVRFWTSGCCYFSVSHIRRSLFKMASNLAIDYLRRKRVMYVLSDQKIPYVSSRTAVTEMDLQFKEALSDREYNIMTLTIIHGLTRPEIAEHLNLKLPTVGANYRRGLSKLREYYGISEDDVKNKFVRSRIITGESIGRER